MCSCSKVSSHEDVDISDHSKKSPATVKIEVNFGADIIDQMGRKYLVGTGTRRLPVPSFQNTLDLAAINA